MLLVKSRSRATKRDKTAQSRRKRLPNFHFTTWVEEQHYFRDFFSTAQTSLRPEGLNEGHYDTSKDLRELRRAIGASPKKWPDHKLHSHTDWLVRIIMTLAVRVTSLKPIKERTVAIERGLIRPANALISALTDSELQKEWFGPDREHPLGFRSRPITKTNGTVCRCLP